MDLWGGDLWSQRWRVAWWSPSLFTPLISALPIKVPCYKKPFPTLYAVPCGYSSSLFVRKDRFSATEQGRKTPEPL